MTDQSEQSVPTNSLAKKRPFYRRLGCMAGIFIWLLIALFSCFALFLLIQQEITISQGDAPDQEIRLWLISEPDQRGVGFSITSATEGEADKALCVQTDVNFLLWQGDSYAIDYCECYAQSETGDLSPTSATSGACPP